MRTRIAVLLVVFVLLLLGGSVLAAQGIPRTPIEWAVIKKLTVTNDADFNVSIDTANDLTTADDITAGDDLFVTDDATVSDNLTAADLYADDWLHLTASTTVAVGAGATITPLGSFQPITSTAAVTTSTSTAIANGSAAGDVLVLHNGNASDAITIDGAGGNVECGGNVALGANDVLTLVWNGSDWTCMALRDN